MSISWNEQTNKQKGPSAGVKSSPILTKVHIHPAETLPDIGKDISVHFWWAMKR